MERIEREYDYRPRWTTIFFGGGFFALCAVVLGLKAAHNDRGVNINGLIQLGREGATTFYWVLAGLSAGFVAISGFLALQRLTFPRRLAFGPTTVLLPGTLWSPGEREVAYEDIVSLSESSVNGQQFLQITHSQGKNTVTASLLPSREAFTEVCELLAFKIRQTQPSEEMRA